LVADAHAQTISVERHAAPNPKPDPFAMVSLLWRTELLDLFLRVTGETISAPNAQTRRRVVEAVPHGHLGALVREQLKARPNWRVGESRG
jgi:hypothetical protein